MELAARKERLLMRSELLRGQMAAHLHRWEPVFEGIDRVRDVGRWLRGHPEVVARPGAAAGEAAALVMRWARRAWVGWKLWSGLRARAAPR